MAEQKKSGLSNDDLRSLEAEEEAGPQAEERRLQRGANEAAEERNGRPNLARGVGR